MGKNKKENKKDNKKNEEIKKLKDKQELPKQDKKSEVNEAIAEDKVSGSADESNEFDNLSILGKRVRIENGDELIKEEEVEEEHSFLWKIRHFWDYNKSTVIVCTVIAVTIILFIRAVVLELREPQIYIAMMNAYLESPGAVTYGDDFGNETGLDPDDGKIQFDTDFVHPYDLANNPMASDSIIASIQRYSAAHTNSYIDVTITSNWVIDEYQKANAFYDLREIYTEDELDEVKDSLYYTENQYGEIVPVAIIVNGIREINELYPNGDTVVIGIPKYTKRLDMAKKFIAWFLGN